MTAAASYNYKQQQQQRPSSSSSSRPPKNPNPNHPLNSAAAAASPFQINPPNPNEDPTSSSAPASPFPVPFQDQVLSKASHLTRLEVLRRRSRKLKQLSKCYRDHYWALMEELKSQYRAYYWNYGLSPFKEDNPPPIKQEPSCDLADSGVCNGEGIGENNNNNNNGSGGIGHCSGSRVLDVKLENNLRCSFVGCNLKAMALTSFCHLHILYDPEQKLYRPCSFVIKSPAAGPITCGKPILSSTVPSYCSSHFRTAHKHVTRALKKAGLNVTSSTKLAPKFHVIVAEYVNQIQAKRQAAKLAGKGKAVDNKS